MLDKEAMTRHDAALTSIHAADGQSLCLDLARAWMFVRASDTILNGLQRGEQGGAMKWTFFYLLPIYNLVAKGALLSEHWVRWAHANF